LSTRPQIIDHEVAIERHLAGLRIDLELAEHGTVGWLGGLALKLPVASSPRRISRSAAPSAHRRLGDVGNGDHLVGADNAVLPSLNSISAASASIKAAAIGLPFSMIASDALGERVAADGRAAGAVGAATDRNLGGVTLHVADGFERHAEPVVHKLRNTVAWPWPCEMRPANTLSVPSGLKRRSMRSLKMPPNSM